MDKESSQNKNAALHDGYAAGYDAQVQAYDCYIADLLFGLCYEFTCPGQVLLDAGIGSGLSAQLFARAGLNIYGMDFSPAMLEICQAKGISVDLNQHDLQKFPWPYPSGQFNHLVCCGVLHFISELEGVFNEAARVLQAGGIFAFTTRVPLNDVPELQSYDRQQVGDFEIYSHAPAYLETQLAKHSFTRLKLQKCFVGADLFLLWVVRRGGL